MSDHDFERPGAPALPHPDQWPYHAPTPEAPAAPPQEEAGQQEDVVVSNEDDPPHRPIESWRVTLVAGVVGALLGGVLVGVLTRPEPAAPSIPITLSTFPREFMGAERNDLELREAGFSPTVERLDKEFEAQVAAFRFAYGGRGATMGYGRLITLTIVDGVLAPDVPREGEMDFGGRVRETRRFVSLNSGAVSCTFEPRPVLNASLGMDDFGTLSSIGRTECVLVDEDRNLGLRVAHSTRVQGSGASEAANSFSDALKALHAKLTA